MALKFLGRIGVEHYITDDGKDATRPVQQFKSGIMAFSEDVPAIPVKGSKHVKPASTRGVALNPTHIGKTVAPEDGWYDEDAVLKKYPGVFEKVMK